MEQMASFKYDVIIVGAGPAGITAAISLAKANIPVLVVEGGVFPGAENWSGAVYFAENLAQPDVLGEKAVLESAYERPVTKRGAYIYNGHTMAGLNYRNPSTFAQCYTVLRPTFDHYLAELARSFGATILTETTVDGLLRDDQGRIIGVHTDRGPIYADVVFLAEGDASHLVTKEGYERCREKGAPHFLQGIAEVIEMAPEEIERQFNLPPGEGAAFEVLLRNGTIHNRTAQLNMGGFIYTNQSSISLGLVLPLDNLAREFGGDHNRLMEWFKSLPEIRRWAGGARSVAYGAKIIRGGGFREVPQLVDNGLAIGGAATGIGIDFPYPNFTGPATAMGRLFANAVKQIRAGDGDFSSKNLEALYEGPLRRTHYFKNVEFLEDWPHYVEHTRVFFGRASDLATGSAYIASNPSLGTGQKIWQLAKFLRETLPPKHVREFIRDLRAQRAALGLDRVNQSPAPSSTARAAEGTVSIELFVDGRPQHALPWPFSRWIGKLPRVLAASCDHLYRNDDTPLPVKLRNAVAAAKRGLPLLDYALLGGFGLLMIVLMPVQWLCEMIKLVVTRPSPEKYLSSFFQKTRALVRDRNKLDPDAVAIAQPWEEKLALIRYFSDSETHIKVLRPDHFEKRTDLAKSPLWHVCPAKVYEDKVDDLGQVQIVVNFENCIKCESCLRGAPDDVDWTRQRKQRLIFGAPTAANRKLLELLKQNGARPRPGTVTSAAVPGLNASAAAKLRQFCEDVYAEPRYVDAARARWLLSLLEQARSFAPDHPALARIITFAGRHKFFWAEAEARQLLQSEPAHAVTDAPRAPVLRQQLDRLFPKQSIKDIEHGKRLTPEQLDFLKALKPDDDVLRELARKDPSLAVLVSGLYPAQIAARPELAGVAWIGLAAARTHAKDFPAMQLVTLPRVAAAVRAIALGAGEMLLERCQAHATSRVQFPGLFKDEDGRDGIAKFGAVKQLLGEMQAQVTLLQALEDFPEADAPLVKLLACEAFGPGPGSLTYNAGQIFGGTAYSEDDVLSKFYRDSTCFAPLLFDNTPLKLKNRPGAKLKNYALNAIKRRAGDSPTELETEIIKLFEEGAVADPAADGIAAIGARILEHGYIDQPLQRPPAFSYRDALDSEQHYDHGDYLVAPLDANEWRYVPEMLFADPDLRAYYDEQYRYFTENFWNRRFDGLPYHHLVEKLHMVPLADVREMVTRGFTRMYIPKEFGGEGLLKAYYYILCPLSMCYADPSYALTIMAHSSIGTTPVLLALNQDLPRAKADLQEFLANASLISNLKSEISKILRMLDSPQALKVKDVFTALGETVKKDIGKKPMLRAVASEFLARFMDAGRAGLRMDLAKFKIELTKSRDALDQIRPRAEAVVAELDRRADACRLFLKFISAGQISAFALTEPSAGSDSGGIQTRAQLKRVEVLTDDAGVTYFLLGTERKNILDAARLEFDFKASRILYRYADGKPAAPIVFDEYDYKTDDPAKFRYYLHDGKRVDIHDIAQIRREGARAFYEYYEVNGAKMWITNGHVAGVMCLYARTPEGPTGFLVDRHAEGLIVGKDEEKMGQRGSPTNELGLTAVRVPRENIIGIEGRGQVNALETLNVGRTGLCVSATAMIAKILRQTRAFARERGLDKLAWVQELLGGMAVELYAIESLASELVGRFDHHGTRDARTESAIGKYYASEALHRAIATAEQIYGIEGVTQLHELEKHRRDARVLNIYEGTNEVQRFLIIRDLVDAVLPKAKQASAAAVGPLEEAKRSLLQDVKRAVDAFGPQVWQNANFQPTMFKLVEIAGHIKLMDSTLWRTQWLRTHTQAEDRAHLDLAETCCASAVEQASRQARRLHEEFDRELLLLQQGLYPPVVRTAFLALQIQETKKRAEQPAPHHHVTQPLRIVVALNVVPVLSPRPRVIDGELLETCFVFDPASRTALERALAVKAGGNGRVRVSVLAVAPRYGLDLLQRALALGADDATLIETRELPGDPHATGRLLADQISRQQSPCDLALCGDALVGTMLAGSLGLPHFVGVESFEACNSALQITLHQPSATLTQQGPVVLTLTAAESARDFTADDYLASLGKPLEIVNAKDLAAEPPFVSHFALPAQPVSAEKTDATPAGAAELLKTLTGIASSKTGGNSETFQGAVEIADKSRVPRQDSAVFLAVPDKLDGVSAAAACAGAFSLPFHVVVVGARDETMMRQVAGHCGGAPVHFLTHPELNQASPEGILAALQSCWKDTLPPLLISGAWANELLARFGNTFPRVQARYNVAEIAARDGGVELACPAFGNVQRVSRAAPLTEHPLIVTLAPGATVHAGNTLQPGTQRVFRIPLELEYDRQHDALAALAAADNGDREKTIADADFIIDVGYAVRNKENFDLIVGPLKKRLEEMGVKNVMIGGTRKVVEELKLLAPNQQIGQTGTPVNPRVIISIGVSGAPQHIDYIGERATIIAFNKDPNAPLMTLNTRRARPKVVPIVGDLYETVPQFMAALK